MKNKTSDILIISGAHTGFSRGEHAVRGQIGKGVEPNGGADERQSFDVRNTDDQRGEGEGRHHRPHLQQCGAKVILHEQPTDQPTDNKKGEKNVNAGQGGW